MLQLLASKKSLDEASGNAPGAGGRKTKKGFIFDPESFSAIPPPKIAKNIDMKPESLGSSQMKR